MAYSSEEFLLELSKEERAPNRYVLTPLYHIANTQIQKALKDREITLVPIFDKKFGPFFDFDRLGEIYHAGYNLAWLGWYEVVSEKNIEWKLRWIYLCCGADYTDVLTISYRDVQRSVKLALLFIYLLCLIFVPLNPVDHHWATYAQNEALQYSFYCSRCNCCHCLRNAARRTGTSMCPLHWSQWNGSLWLVLSWNIIPVPFYIFCSIYSRFLLYKSGIPCCDSSGCCRDC